MNNFETLTGIRCMLRDTCVSWS